MHSNLKVFGGFGGSKTPREKLGIFCEKRWKNLLSEQYIVSYFCRGKLYSKCLTKLTFLWSLFFGEIEPSIWRNEGKCRECFEKALTLTRDRFIIDPNDSSKVWSIFEYQNSDQNWQRYFFNIFSMKWKASFFVIHYTMLAKFPSSRELFSLKRADRISIFLLISRGLHLLFRQCKYLELFHLCSI